MAGAADSFLKVTAGVSLFFCGFAVGYYFLFYLPDRDARLDAQNRQAIVDQQYRAEHSRRTREGKEAADVRAENVQVFYESCIRNAGSNYSLDWDTSCKSIADKNNQDRSSCTFGRDFCEAVYPLTPTKNCSLPQAMAAAKNDTLEKARNRCLQESLAGFQ